jgi:hypothetical protein
MELDSEDRAYVDSWLTEEPGAIVTTLVAALEYMDADGRMKLRHYVVTDSKTPHVVGLLETVKFQLLQEQEEEQD